VRRKVFRIEQTLAMGRKPAAAPAIARHTNGEVTSDNPAPRLAGRAPCLNRAAGELGAAVEGMEKAVQTILQSAEVIDERTKAIANAHRNGREQKFAEEVQDHLTRIYEACNFQDIAGQRIGKVIETLSTVDNRKARSNGNGADHEPATGRSERANPLLNGPRLDGESDSVTQHDVDALFR
jgi:chemotaxis protein CheZ